MSIDYEYDQAVQEIERAAELYNQAANLPNPGGFWRGFQELFSDSSGETYAEKQAAIDTRREELYAEGTEHMKEAASWARSVLDYLEGYGIPKEKMVSKITAMLGDNPSPYQAGRCLTVLKDAVTLVNLLSELRSRFSEERGRIKQNVSSIASKYGMDGRVIIRNNDNEEED
jgi:hypothetical protein